MSPPNDDGQGALFEVEQFDWWREHWKDMPEFVNEDQTSFKQVIVHFATREDMEAFAALVEQTITEKTQSIWYPEAEIGRYVDKRYRNVGEEKGGDDVPR